MNTRGFTLVLLLVMAGNVVAQVPRTINYQGRVKDAGGFLQGARSVTLQLYDRSTGGPPLFSETQNVDFANGIFTVAIGGGTPGGLPPTVDFAKQYWLGVTIQGFNGDQEISPRLRFHSSATSIRAALADSAVMADTARFARNAASALTAVTAGTAQSAATATVADSSRAAGFAETALSIELPALLASEPTKSTPVLRVTSLEQKTGVGLLAEGQAYAVVAKGIDSTSEHYVAAANAPTSASPAVGGYYRDNAPVAWALIDSNGTRISDFGLSRVAHQSGAPGQYEIQLRNPMQIPAGSNVPALAAVVTVEGSLDGTAPVFAYWSFKKGGNGFDPSTIVVTIRTLENLGVDRRFSIQVFGRPE